MNPYEALVVDSLLAVAVVSNPHAGVFELSEISSEAAQDFTARGLKCIGVFTIDKSGRPKTALSEELPEGVDNVLSEAFVRLVEAEVLARLGAPRMEN